MSKSVYDMVTDRVIEMIEKDKCLPWCKPWTGTRTAAFNRISKKPYSLLNQILLGNPDGSTSNEWATFKQWSDLGGKIRKGAKSRFVVFWKINEKMEKNEDGEEVKKTYAILKYYNVFHISQVEGVEPLPDGLNKDIEEIPTADELFNLYISREGIAFEQTASDKAYYSPSRDLIHLPLKEQFQDMHEYWSTAYHEVVHSSGHPLRLRRLESGAVAAFGSESYSKEELTAELGSAMILNQLGIETPKTFSNSAAYLQNWMNAIREDTHLIVSASSRAEKAVAYILNQA
jgi:antirestriction protein ArdC